MSTEPQIPVNKFRPFSCALDSKLYDPNIVAPRNYERRNLVQSGLIPDRYVKRNTVGTLVDETDSFKDPYPRSYKARLANAYEFDGVIKSALHTLVNYVLKGDFRLELIPTTRVAKDTPEEVQQALDEVLSTDEQKETLDFCGQVDNMVKLKRKLRPALIQKYVFGRSALFKEYASSAIEEKAELVELGFRQGVPIFLKPLNSYWLGQVHVDLKSWEPKAVEYDDVEWIRDDTQAGEAQPPLKIEDLIYFTNDDSCVAPNSLNYGLSQLQNILTLSGANRRLNEKVLPELNTSAYAGSGLFKFQGMSAKDIKNFVDTVLPASIKATNQAVDFQQVKLDYDMNGLLEERDRNDKHIAMAVRIPSPFINFEDITNRATTEQVAIVWQQTVLEPARAEVRDVLWEQWYKPLIEFYWPESEFLYLKIKIQTVFESLDFNSLPDKAQPLISLYKSGLLTQREVREELARPPFPPDQEQLQTNLQKFMNENPSQFIQTEDVQNAQNVAQQRQEELERAGVPLSTKSRLKAKTLLNQRRPNAFGKQTRL